ncbi:hypothetical protein [Vannielia litorea]|uniref:hypothetical protein n=1 Tax=Vannielia litorea TaxID=1217970 RepID=UPI001BD07BCB|nr:hypothetical protein [Vannielia litorea]MBS8228402.1 hypothetical protein [Vannielia litorea]
MTVLSTYRAPFHAGFPVVRQQIEGASLAEMVAATPELPEGFAARGVIALNGHPVSRAYWGQVRPKATLPNGARVEVGFFLPHAGGDDGGGKVFAAVASIALIALTGGIAGGALTKIGFGSAFAAGSTGAYLAAGVVGLVGQQIIGGLSPTPAIPDQGSYDREASGPASVSGNLIEPNGPIPRVAGTRRLFPPHMTPPFTYFDGNDEVVEAVVGLAGPHAFSDIRVDGAPIAQAAGIEFEVREGRPGDAPLSLVTRQAHAPGIGEPLSKHTVADSDNRTLESQSGALSDALPQTRILATREAPDEAQIQLAFQGGLHKSADVSKDMRVPFRLRIRQVGADDWVELPELHYQAADLATRRGVIRLVWTDDATLTPAAAASGGWVEARTTSPGQTEAPATTTRAAASYFHDGAGDTWMDSNNLGSTGLEHVSLDRFEAVIALDTATYPKGRYEVELLRGAPFRDSNYSASSYEVSGVVWDLFGYQEDGGQKIVESRAEVSDECYLMRFASIWNEHPAPTDDLALIAIKARARTVSELSCLASGLVPDWDGSAWRGLVATANPVPHLRDVFAGRLNRAAVPAAVMDDAGLVAWRTACAAAGQEVNAVIEDMSVSGAASLIAACGYARPTMADLWGVMRDYDRSAEAPVQIFTARNMRDFRMQKVLARRPDGFLVNFRDVARDFEARQITVPDSARGGELEQVTYEGLVTEAEVRARAEYDLLSTRLRAATYSFAAPAMAILCRRGALIGVEQDVITRRTGAARVANWAENGAGEVTEIDLDAEVEVLFEDDMHAVADMHAVEDMHLVGVVSAVALRRTDGSITTHTLTGTSGTTSTLTLATPISGEDLAEGVMAVVGPAARVLRRMIVMGIRPRAGLEFTLTCKDEAPEIFA